MTYKELRKILFSNSKNKNSHKDLKKKDNQDGSTIYQFTRHANSCNNAGLGKTFGKDYEPGLTDYGISKTIEINDDDNFKFNNNNKEVFVSCLYRTWCTAVLLYCNKTNFSNSRQNEPNDLTLIVSPHLKEKAKYGILRGNYPKPINHTIDKFLLFLNNFGKIRKRGFNRPNKIIIKFPSHSKTDEKEQTYTLYFDNNEWREEKTGHNKS